MVSADIALTHLGREAGRPAASGPQTGARVGFRKIARARRGRQGQPLDKTALLPGVQSDPARHPCLCLSSAAEEGPFGDSGET